MKVKTAAYVPVTNLDGKAIGIAKMSADGTADMILFPACPKHDKPTKVRVSMGFQFPMEIS